MDYRIDGQRIKGEVSTTKEVLAYKPFPLAVLPDAIRRYIAQSARAIGCDAAFVALPMLSALASAVGNTRRIKLKRTWCEPCVLWTVLVGDSGTHKTPALATATAVKLGRALWIAPTTALLGRRTGEKRAKIPLFIVGFVVAAALGTFVLPQIAAPVSAGARRLLVGCLFLVGTGISPKALRENGWRPLLHGTLLWIIVAAITLTAVARGWIS